jgi:hypothetical protein
MESILETEENDVTGPTIAAHCELYFQPEDSITVVKQRSLIHSLMELSPS